MAHGSAAGLCRRRARSVHGQDKILRDHSPPAITTTFNQLLQFATLPWPAKSRRISR